MIWFPSGKPTPSRFQQEGLWLRQSLIRTAAWKWQQTDSTRRRRSAVSAISPQAKKPSPLVSSTPSPRKTTSSPPTDVTASHSCAAHLSSPSSESYSVVVRVLPTEREDPCTCSPRVSMEETVSSVLKSRSVLGWHSLISITGTRIPLLRCMVMEPVTKDKSSRLSTWQSFGTYLSCSDARVCP